MEQTREEYEQTRQEYERYRERLWRSWRRGFWIALALALAIGFAVGQATDLLVGAAVTLVLFALAECLLAFAVRAAVEKHFPVMREHREGWAYDGWVVKLPLRRRARQP